MKKEDGSYYVIQGLRRNGAQYSLSLNLSLLTSRHLWRVICGLQRIHNLGLLLMKEHIRGDTILDRVCLNASQ